MPIDLSALQSLFRIGNIFGPNGMGGAPPMGSLPGDGTISGRTGNDNPLVMNMAGQARTMPQDPQQPLQPMAPQQPDQQYNPSDQISKLYADALQQMPQRDEPSKWRKFGAAIASGAGKDASQSMAIKDQFLYNPYYRKLSDWKTKVDSLGKGSAEEDRQNVNKRILFTQGESQDTKKAALAEKEREARAKEEISNRRADAYVFDKTHPDMKPFAVKGGNLIYVNPKDPTEVHDTGIPTGTLSDEERIKLATQGRLDVTAAAGAQQRQTENVREGNREQLEGTKETNRQSDIAARGTQARQTNDAKPATARTGTGARPELPTQKKVRIFNNAQQALVEHPEWKPYVKLSPGNVVTIATPAWYSGGAADKATMDKIHSAIYGEQPAPVTAAAKPAGTTATHPMMLTGPDGKVYDTSTWKQADIDSAKKNGFK